MEVISGIEQSEQLKNFGEKKATVPCIPYHLPCQDKKDEITICFKEESMKTDQIGFAWSCSRMHMFI